MNYRIALFSFLLVATLSVSVGQSDPEAGVNPNSLFNIPVYEQVYKVRVWRDFMLKEKQNKGFFARGNEMTTLLVAAIRSGQIPNVYKDDSLKTIYPKDEFYKLLELQAAQTFTPWDQNSNYVQSDRVTYNGKDYEALQDNVGQTPDVPNNDYWIETKAGQAISFTAANMDKIEIVEDIIFDKRRSRLYYDIQAFKLWGWDENGQFYKPIGVLKYKDVEKVFRAQPEKAIWFNRQNTAQNRNLADAFLLRLFHATIKKVENPDDLELSAIYSADQNQAVWAREWEEMKLMEKEHNLWEY